MKRLTKILFINEVLWLGGAERILIDVVNNLPKSKYKVTVCTILEDTQPNKYLNGDIKYTYIYSKVDKKDNALSILISKVRNKLILMIGESTYCNLLFKGKYDFIISFKGTVTAKLINKLHDKRSKKIAWFHSDATYVNFGNNVHKYRELFSQFDKIVCVSNACKESFDLIFNLREKTIVIFNPLDERVIISKSKEAINDFPDSSEKVLCSVGRLEKLKGYITLLEIHKKLLELKIYHKLIIIGEGDEKSNLLRFIRENNLQDTAFIVGHKDNPYPYIAKSDIFVFSSVTEAYCTAIVEALILKKPVVTTDCGGMKEILGESVYGLVTEKNSESLFNGIKNMLCDQELYEHYRNKAIERSCMLALDERMKEIEKLLSL